MPKMALKDVLMCLPRPVARATSGDIGYAVTVLTIRKAKDQLSESRDCPVFHAKGWDQKVRSLSRIIGAPEGTTTLLLHHFSKCSRPFIQSVKSTLSYLKSCHAVRGTPWSTAWWKARQTNFFAWISHKISPGYPRLQWVFEKFVQRSLYSISGPSQGRQNHTQRNDR